MALATAYPLGAQEIGGKGYKMLPYNVYRARLYYKRRELRNIGVTFTNKQLFSCWYKTRHEDTAEALPFLEQSLEEGKDSHIYHCEFCAGYHIGQRRKRKKKNSPSANPFKVRYMWRRRLVLLLNRIYRIQQGLSVAEDRQRKILPTRTTSAFS